MKFLIAIALLVSTSAFRMMGGDGNRDHRSHEMMSGSPFEKMSSFFKGLNSTAVQELQTIWRNANSTIAQQKQAVLTWAEKYNRTEQVTEHFTNISNWKTTMQNNVTNLISQLTAVNKELQKIFNNDQQTRAEMFEAIKELRNSSGQAVDVIFAIPKIAFHHGGDRREHGHGGHGKMEAKARGGHGGNNKMGAAGAAMVMGAHMLNNGVMGGNKAHPIFANKMASQPDMNSVHHG